MTESFDEVHVVSDLHLGGRAGFQIFREGPRLANTIAKLAARPAHSLALVLNGDIVDFLAEEPVAPSGLDPLGAVQKLQRIVEHDAAFSGVFAALRAFITGAGRQLVIVLGNHDVELALPNVQHWLGEWLCQGKPERRARITWATDGAGFACSVSGKRVLCLHGNEVDAWNVVDYRALLEVTRALNREQPPPTWKPNAGTRMVVEVMNQLKRVRPIVDLLKPETRAAVPVVLALDPSQLRSVTRVLQFASKKAFDSWRLETGYLGEAVDPEHEQQALPEARARPNDVDTLDSVLRDALGHESRESPRARTLRLQQRIHAEATGQVTQVTAAPAGDGGDELLGFSRWFDQDAKPATLRASLKYWLSGDTTFVVDQPDDQFRALDEAVGAGVDYLVAGHTHLRRALRRSRSPGAFYFNTGTWIRLVELPGSVLESEQAFHEVLEQLGSDTLLKLDAAKLADKPLVKSVPTVASITTDASARVSGALYDAAPDGTLSEVPETRYPR